MASILQVKLLGEFSVTYEDRPVASISSARSQALLAYLILHRQLPQPRQRIAFHLWESSTDTQAGSNLRKELTYLRRALPNPEQFLLVESKTLQWSPMAPCSIDILAVEDAIKAVKGAEPHAIQALLEQAIALYSGDLLPSCEDEWIVSERERFQQLHLSALEQLIDHLQQQQDYRAALRYAQQLLRVDVCNEATYCTLMRLYSRSGDRANALQTYHRCMTLLREALGVDPSASTRKLYEQILLDDEVAQAAPAIAKASTPLPTIAPIAAASPLVGREREWATVQHWYDCAANCAEMLLVVGEPGIGKTRLLEELRSTLAEHQILWGRGFAAEMVRPYGIWTDALRSFGVGQPRSPMVLVPPELGVLLPELGVSGQALPDRSHLFDAVVQLFAAQANHAPFVVVLDDIQWIDEASSALLHYAVRLLSHLPIKFACTARVSELKENAAIERMLQALRREQRLRILELQPFDRGQTADLIRSIPGSIQAINASDLSLELVDQIFSDSGGNPLFALEIARAWSQDRVAHGDNLEALIRDRLQRLDPSARELLPWAAALGRSFKPTTVAQVSDYALPQLLTAIEQLEQQTIIRPSISTNNEPRYDFVHDIVRQTVYRQLSEPRRQLVHLQIAHKLNQQLTADSVLVSDVAHHAALGGDHELATFTAVAAAERCLKLFAYAEAAKLAIQGIQHCQPLDQRTRIRRQLQLLRVVALAGVTGDRAVQLETEVNQLMDEARQLGLKDEEAIGLEAIGLVYYSQGNFINTREYSLRAVEISQSASPATAARLLAYSGSCLAELGHDIVRAEALLLEAQSLAARVGLELCDIYSGLGAVHLYWGHYDEARSQFKQAWQLSLVEQDHWREFYYLSYLVMLEIEAGNLADALTFCQQMAIVSAQIQGEGSEGAIAAALEALINYKLHHPEAEPHFQQVVLRLQQVDAKRMLSYILIGAAEVDLEQRRWELASARAETAIQSAQIMQHPNEIALAWAVLTQATLALGQPERATQLATLLEQIDRHTLSFRAQNAVNQTIQQLQATSI
ncbi:MAG: BTAD domain-containing putative transcriptional regulator [Leptolyngbyaceae cyanobacterium bins.349]|nr:BTAD domain-containing putative transcriptional regulator [Leptolyngbyaceae cyanobacterium bins.349]